MLIYAICFIAGGIFVGLSALGGLDGVDFETDFDSDVDLGADAEVDTDLDGSIDDIDVGTQAGSQSHSRRLGRTRRRGLWLPFLSFRFWTFGLCFFGLTGLLLSWVQPDLASWIVLSLAIAMGLICGVGAAVTLRLLGGQRGANSLVRSEDMVGLLGTVEIPFDANSRGKVQLAIKGSTLSLAAFTQEAREFQRGEKVLIVGMENNNVWVVSADELRKEG